MKVNRLDAHDRLEHFKEDQNINIFEGAQDCLQKNPDSLIMQEHSPYVYIFAHARTADDGTTKRMLWQPRLTKPKAQSNSYLFRAQSKTDIVEVCWIIPPEDLWKQYQRGNLVYDPTILWSINMFRLSKKKLEQPAYDDLLDAKVKSIYKMIVQYKREQDAKKRINLQLQTSN